MCKLCRPEITSVDIKKYKIILARVDDRSTIKKLPALHQRAFSEISCLNCANCCKNHGATFKPSDIKRIAKHLQMKEGDFVTRYLRNDEDEDYVTKTLPCPFLGSDNYCSIYEVRPTDCRRYPYTDEDVLVKKKALTLKNVEVCPAVTYVLDEIAKGLNKFN
ncbi:MAG: YkgJ family cysteine cluster protein [Flavobacteriales bacterium]